MKLLINSVIVNLTITRKELIEEVKTKMLFKAEDSLKAVSAVSFDSKQYETAILQGDEIIVVGNMSEDEVYTFVKKFF